MDPVLKESRFYHRDVEDNLATLKQLLQEKEIVIVNNSNRVEELQKQIAKLEEKIIEIGLKNEGLQKIEEKCLELEKQHVLLETELYELREFQNIRTIVNTYDELVQDAITKYETVKEQRNILHIRLLNLESAFADIVGKYEDVKAIVLAFQQNQDNLLDELKISQHNATESKEKFESFKNHANQKIKEANAEIAKLNKQHLAETARLKAKVLQSQARINDFEKKLSIMKSNNTIGDAVSEDNIQSPFAPLADIT